MAGSSHHQIDWAASGLRRAAAQAGVALPVAYARAVAADGLGREPALGVTRLGAGVVLHTQPETDRRLPVVLDYADARCQWYRPVWFDAAGRTGDTLAVRVALPEVPARRLGRLSASARLAHQHLAAMAGTVPPVAQPAPALAPVGVSQ